MKHLAWLGLGVIVMAAACDDAPLTPQDRMRAQYAPTQAVTVGSLSFDVYLALQPDVVYAAGANRLVQIDRATGAVVELFSDYQNRQIARIAADATHVYLVLQAGGGPVEVVRIARETGTDERVLAPADRSFYTLEVHDGLLYAFITEAAPVARWELVEIDPADGAIRRLADLPAGAVTSMVAADDGIYFGLVGSSGDVWFVPYAGAAPVSVQAWPDKMAFHVAADASGVYWNAGDSAVGASGPAELFFHAAGGAAPQLLAGDVTRGEFSVNDLGFYWVDDEQQAIRAVAREDVGGGAFDLIDATEPPMGLVADDRAIVYSSNGGELGDLKVHVVPRVQ